MGYFNYDLIDDFKQDNAQLFVDRYFPEANEIEKETGLSAIAIMTQSALESGWGARVKGNNLFGIKWNGKGKKQLIKTREILPRKDFKFPVIHSIKPYGTSKFLYIVDDYFMLYDDPKESFMDYVSFIQRYPRYKKAWEVRHDHNLFFDEIAKAGYATAPDYAKYLKSVAKSVIKRL